MKPVIIPDDALKRFRNAATQFTRDATPRASRLLSVKDDIAALREKGASFRTIGELLTQNGIAASDTCVMRFCHSQLGEKPVRSVKRKSAAAPKSRRICRTNQPVKAARASPVSNSPNPKNYEETTRPHPEWQRRRW